MDTPVTTTYTTETTTNKAVSRNAALDALAVVGFVALIIIGITLAIYCARFIPGAVSKITSTSATLGNPNSQNTGPAPLSVVSSSSTMPYNQVTTTTTLPPPGSINTGGYGAPQPTPVTTTHAPAPKPVVRAPYGLPDLAVTILATGYLTGQTTDTFVPATIIPPGARPAVKFSVADVGTNSTGPWSFLAQIPTLTGAPFNSPVEASMNPGDHVVFTMGFNLAAPGSQAITVVADPNHLVQESNEVNNVATAHVTVTQTGN